VIFYLGTHMLNHARNFDKCFISANRLERYRTLKAHDWILDSGAFSEIKNHGRFRNSAQNYADLINHFRQFGNLEMAVSQDYMCEPAMLERTGLTVKDHQKLTIERYDALIKLTDVLIMPVLQGYEPKEYAEHLDMYGDRLKYGMRVGVGSVCKRNGDPKQIIAVLEAIKAKRPDLKLHGFGIKITALSDAYIISMLYSADSMAWSMSARRNGRNANALTEAIAWQKHLETVKGTKGRQLSLMCEDCLTEHQVGCLRKGGVEK